MMMVARILRPRRLCWMRVVSALKRWWLSMAIWSCNVLPVTGSWKEIKNLHLQKAGLTTVHAKKSELKKSVPQLEEALLCGLLSRLLQSEPAELHLPPPVCPASCWMRTLVGTSGHPAWPGRWTYKNKNKLKKNPSWRENVKNRDADSYKYLSMFVTAL